jgi:hypothetical protein
LTHRQSSADCRSHFLRSSSAKRLEVCRSRDVIRHSCFISVVDLTSVTFRMRGSSSGVRDLVELKLQKKLLQEKLSENESQTKRINSLLEKKKRDPNSSLFDGRGRDNQNRHLPEMTTMVLGNITLQELRPQLRSSKVIPRPPPVPISDLEPTPIPFGSNLERIRLNHIKRTVGKQEIMKRTKMKQEVEQNKARKDGMKHSAIKIPESMFPNRYLRGELPCTIEHGVRGLYLSWVCPLDNLDYDYYLPIFFDGSPPLLLLSSSQSSGLQCTEEHIVFLAKQVTLLTSLLDPFSLGNPPPPPLSPPQGIEDMLYACNGNAERVLPSLPKFVRPLRNALSKFNVPILLNVLQVLTLPSLSLF